MTEFCTQVHGRKEYQITVKTDNKEHYLRIQQAARECVDNAPTIDADPVVHGHWNEKALVLDWCEDDVDIVYECSCCGTNGWVSPYCPNCGAKMEEEAEHE